MTKRFEFHIDISQKKFFNGTPELMRSHVIGRRSSEYKIHIHLLNSIYSFQNVGPNHHICC